MVSNSELEFLKELHSSQRRQVHSNYSGLIDHTVATDHRIEAIIEHLKRLGVSVEEEQATADKFDPNYFNRIVD